MWLLKELGFHINHVWQVSNIYFCFSFVFYFFNGGVDAFLPLVVNLGLAVNLMNL